MIITIVAFDVNRSDSCPSLWTMPFLTLIMALKRLIDWIVIIDYNSDDEKQSMLGFHIILQYEHLWKRHLFHNSIDSAGKVQVVGIFNFIPVDWEVIYFQTMLTRIKTSSSSHAVNQDT